GQLRAVVKVQNARQEQALIQYEQVILRALEDTENAFVAYSTEQTRRQSLQQAVAADQRSVDLSNELYYRGLTDFLNVLDAQRTLYVVQLQLAQSEANVSANLVALFKALGGGWETEAGVAPAGGVAPAAQAGAATQTAPAAQAVPAVPAVTASGMGR
ncbi:MAG TPA: TolC family protein, partial [Armatimonadota bacterium]